LKRKKTLDIKERKKGLVEALFGDHKKEGIHTFREVKEEPYVF
jgi:hypothetical protein